MTPMEQARIDLAARSRIDGVMYRPGGLPLQAGAMSRGTAPETELRRLDILAEMPSDDPIDARWVMGRYGLCKTSALKALNGMV